MLTKYSMEDGVHNILKHLNNNHTKVQIKQDFKGNYYSYLTDTIYIADGKSNSVPKQVKDLNPNTGKLITVCHECIHAIQPTYLHILNMMLSNLVIIFMFINVITKLFFKTNNVMLLLGLIITLSSILVRIIMEKTAIDGSILLAKKLVENENILDVSKRDIATGIEFVNNKKYLALLQMLIDKIIIILLTIFIAII